MGRLLLPGPGPGPTGVTGVWPAGMAALDPRARPFAAGTAAGVAAGFIGHPLDTIRVRMQTQRGAATTSALACARGIVVKEGARALFKGLAPQMLGYCSHSAIRFGVFGNAKPERSPSPLTNGLGATVSGAKAGVCLSPLISVLELLKCRQQVSRAVPQPPLREVLASLLRSEGPRGLTCGYLTCLPRNIFGNGSFFGLFEALKTVVDERLAADEPDEPGLERRALRAAAYIGCSMVAGSTSWCIVFPIDTCKTNIVTVADPAKRPLARAVAARLWREGGLYRGLGPTLVRSVPVNAVYLPTFVYVNEWLAAAD